MGRVAVLRARTDDEKDERRRRILRAALTLFESGSFQGIKVADVAARAGLAKGTVFLYFATKEALFLGLLEARLEVWLATLDDELARGKGRWSPGRVARLVADTLADHVALTRLLPLLSSVLEHNVTLDQARSFKQWLAARLPQTGARLERRLPFLRAGEGARLLLWIDAAVVGLRQLSDPAPVARQALADPALSFLSIEFTTELVALLRSVLTGLERARS